MRHRQVSRRLSRWAGARKGLLNSLLNAFIKNEAIRTTVARAKETRRIAEKMITQAKANSLHSRRRAAMLIHEHRTLQKLFNVLGPRYSNRNGGYTRIVRIGYRKGDGAELALLEFVDRPKVNKEKKKKKQKGEPKKEEAKEGNQ